MQLSTTISLLLNPREIVLFIGKPKGRSMMISNVEPSFQTEMFVVPWIFTKHIAPRIMERLRTLVVTRDCLFSTMNTKHQNTVLQWNESRQIIYECRGICGGLGDRMKGIFCVLLHAIAIGYDFRIDWDSRYSLHPTILLPSSLVDWQTPPSRENKGPWHRMTFLDTRAKSYGLCQWHKYPFIKIKSNGNPKPDECDVIAPSIKEILNNQSSTMSCIKTIHDSTPSGTQCMGCVWWYLFCMGTSLQKKVLIEFDHLSSWKKAHHLKDAFSIGIHIRSGDSQMRGTRGRESNLTTLLLQMQTCVSWVVTDLNTSYYGVVVSDSQEAKKIIQMWNWIDIYPVRTKPFHIDKNIHKNIFQTMEAVLSTLADIFMLAFQDSLLLSGSSGYGRLAQSVGMYAGSSVVHCVMNVN